MDELERFAVLNSYAKTIDLLAKWDIQLAYELSYWIIQYGIYGKEPPKDSNPFMLASFEQIKKPIDTCRAKSWNAKKNWKNVLNQNEIKSKSSENQIERKEKIKNKNINNISTTKENRFEEFWDAYPLKKWKPKAKLRYEQAISKWVSEDLLIQKAKEYAEECKIKWTEPQYIKRAEGWLNAWRYEDWYTTEQPKKVSDWDKPYDFSKDKIIYPVRKRAWEISK